MSGYLPAIGAKAIEPLVMVDRVVTAAVEVREGPEALRRAIWRDESGAEVWVHLLGDAPQTTTVLFHGTGRVAGRLAGFSPPADGPQNGQVLLTELEPALAPRLVLDLAEYGDAITRVCTGRRVSAGIAALLTEGHVYPSRAAYLDACSRRGADLAAPLLPIGLRPQGVTPNATLVGTLATVEERRNTLTGERFLAMTVEWEGNSLELAASPADLRGEPPRSGAYLTARVWIVGYDLAYATPVPASPAALPLGVGSVAAFTGWNGYLQLLQVTRIEQAPPETILLHVRVFAELFGSLEALQAHQGNRQVAISHLAIDAGALLDSDVMPLGTAALEAVDEEAYRAWHQAFERGEAGVFGIPLDQVMHLLANAQNPAPMAAAAGPEPPSAAAVMGE